MTAHPNSTRTVFIFHNFHMAIPNNTQIHGPIYPTRLWNILLASLAHCAKGNVTIFTSGTVRGITAVDWKSIYGFQITGDAMRIPIHTDETADVTTICHWVFHDLIFKSNVPIIRGITKRIVDLYHYPKAIAIPIAIPFKYVGFSTNNSVNKSVSVKHAFTGLSAMARVSNTIRYGQTEIKNKQ